MINESDLELRLLAGMPIDIEGLGSIYLPVLRGIIQIGESVYNELLSLLLLNRQTTEGLIGDNISSLELLRIYSLQNKAYQYKILAAFNLFFKKKASQNEEGLFYFTEKNQKTFLQESQFGEIQHVLRKGNIIKIQETDEYHPANDRAAKFIKQMLQTKKDNPKPKPKQELTLHSIISGLAWRSNNLNIFDIFNLTIYQMYDAFYRLECIDHYHNTLSGIYTGAIDSRKIDIKNISWAKTIN